VLDAGTDAPVGVAVVTGSALGVTGEAVTADVEGAGGAEPGPPDVHPLTSSAETAATPQPTTPSFR
jgi:hypothetical protein